MTNDVRIPAYCTAAALLLRVGKNLFDAATRREGLPDPELYGHYTQLRGAAQKMFDTHDTVLSPRVQAGVVLALKAAHDLAHDLDTTPQPELSECPCLTAEAARVLTLKLIRMEATA